MAKKTKCRGEGGIYPQNGTNNSNCTSWVISIPLGKADGKYRRKKKRFHGTYTEAVAEKRRMLLERDSVSGIVLDRTVGELLDLFTLKRAKSGNYAQRTLQCDECRKKLLKRHLEGEPVTQLNAEKINHAYALLRAGNSASGKKLSGTTLLGAHKLLKMALKEPMKKGEVDPNLFDDVVAPVRDTPEKKALPNKVAIELMEKLDPSNSHYMAVLLCLALGLRQSESIAVRWEDIDADANVLHLCRALNPDGTEKGTKNGEPRDMPLLPIVKEALALRRNAQKKLARIAAGAFKEGDAFDESVYQEKLTSLIYVCSDRPIPMKPATFKTWWADHKKRLGVPCTMHELRHTYLTMLARAKVHPRVMQNLGGHKTMDITMGIYTHIDMSEKQAAANALDAMLLKAKYANSSSTERAIIALTSAASLLQEAIQAAAVHDASPSIADELLVKGKDTLFELLERARGLSVEQLGMINLEPANEQESLPASPYSIKNQAA